MDFQSFRALGVVRVFRDVGLWIFRVLRLWGFRVVGFGVLEV